MRYKNTVEGRFISRPNRFIAYVTVDGEEKICHVKNTGRCRELLTEGARVILERSDNPQRRTEYDLVAVYKGEELINIDSQAPNKVFGEWIRTVSVFKDITLVRPETAYKNSRFDFYIEADGRKIFVEVKGVTLERNGVVLFPDAPTERGVKHIRELIDAKNNGYDAYIFFVIQMKDYKYFIPNADTDAEFASVLKEAYEKGVNIRAVNCTVRQDYLAIDGFIDVIIP